MRTLELCFDVWDGCFKLVLLGDLHLGNANTDEALIESVSQRLKEQGTYWLDLGDAIDAINMQDPRFDPTALPEWVGVKDLGDLPKCQIDRYYHYLGQRIETCLCRLEGNHEYQLHRHYERDIYREINHRVSLPDERALGVCGFLRLRFRDRHGSGKIANTWTQTLFLHHGSGGGKRAGSKAGNLELLPMAFEADIYAVGHTHTKLTLSKRVMAMEPKRGGIVEKQQILVNVGAFMRGFRDGEASYAERALMYPQDLGPIELWFYPSRQEIKIIQ